MCLFKSRTCEPTSCRVVGPTTAVKFCKADKKTEKKKQNLNRNHAEFAVQRVGLSRTRQRQSGLCKRRLQMTSDTSKKLQGQCRA